MIKDESFLAAVGAERIGARQVDELIGLARGLTADGMLNQQEVEFLQKWLAANLAASGHPVIGTLYHRVGQILADGIADAEECRDLMDTLNALGDRDFELGEVLKATTLPLCAPAPVLTIPGTAHCFTGTFNFGSRKECEHAVVSRGGSAGSLTRKTGVLVVGLYATESWKHSSFGNKIVKAAQMRDEGVPIRIVSEQHWMTHL